MTSRKMSAACVSLFGAAVAMAIACGKVDDPKPVEVTKLKPAMRLQLIPGDGQITLKWSANNNESDFSGYNIYMSETAPDTLATGFGLTADSEDPQAFTPIQFQNADGEEIKAVKTKLAELFNVDPTTKKPAANTEGKYNPYARCNVERDDTGGACVDITEASDAHEEKRANGFVNYTVKGLENGKAYSFFVAATMDSGKKAVFPATNVMWARPRAVPAAGLAFEVPTKKDNPNASFTFPEKYIGFALPTTGEPTKHEYLRGYQKSFCIPLADDDGEIDSTELKNAKKLHVVYDRNLNDPQNSASGIKNHFLVGVNGTRIAELGAIVGADGKTYAEDVNSEYRLRGTALVPAVAGVTPAPEAAPAATDIGVAAGYSTCGQSVRLVSYHLYSIAIPVGETGWRYALVSTGLLGNAAPTLKVAIGQPGDRKL